MYIPDKFKDKLQIDYQPQKSRVMGIWEWRPQTICGKCVEFILRLICMFHIKFKVKVINSLRSLKLW